MSRSGSSAEGAPDVVGAVDGVEYDAAGSAAAGKQTAAAAREPLTRAVTAAAPLMRCPDPAAIAFRVRKQALRGRFHLYCSDIGRFLECGIAVRKG